MNTTALPRRLLAEFVGTGLLVTVVVRSGIAAAQLSPHDVGLQLPENSTPTAFGLAVLILLLGPVSGAHFNPVVTGADWLLGRRAGTGMTAPHATAYLLAQVAGGIGGALLANLMFDLRGGDTPMDAAGNLSNNTAGLSMADAEIIVGAAVASYCREFSDQVGGSP